MLGHMVSCMFKHETTQLFSKGLYHFTFFTNNMKIPAAPPSLPTLGIISPSSFSPSESQVGV